MRTVEEIKADIKSISELQTTDIFEQRSNLTKIHALERELQQTVISGIPLDRLEVICAAEKDGRLVTLPCKVDDTVYVISGHGARSNPEIVERTVYSFYVEENGRVLLKLGTFDGCYSDELGKITGSPFWEGYYLTRAEAEKALEEKK